MYTTSSSREPPPAQHQTLSTVNAAACTGSALTHYFFMLAEAVPKRWQKLNRGCVLKRGGSLQAAGCCADLPPAD